MLWIKAFHIIAMVAWFAGLFYLPRLYVYHAGNPGQETGDLLRTMERRLYRGIMIPAMVATVGLGIWLWLAFWPGAGGWLHAKVALVALLIGYHFYLGTLRKRFASGINPHSPGFYRILNEIPTLFLIGIVVLVELKPGT